MPGISKEKRVEIIEAEISLLDPQSQNQYFCMVDNGQDPVFAHMIVMKEAAMMGKSDGAFNERARRRMSGMNEENQAKILEAAAKAGINTNGKYYVGGLGRYTDKHAWVSGVDDIKHVAKEKNLTVTGAVEHKGTPVPPPKPVPLAQDLIENHKQNYLKDPKTRENVSKKKNGMKELEEMIVAKHGKQT